MTLRLSAGLVLLLSSPAAASADMLVVGFSRIPRDFVLEIEADFPNHRFWLVSHYGAEPLDLAAERSCRVGRADGSRRFCCIVAAPVGLVEEMGQSEFKEKVLAGKLPPGVIRSEEFDLVAFVPFYDSRERVIDRYRVELVPGKEIRLVWLESNAGSPWVKGAWVAAGVLLAIAPVWFLWWLVRRVRRQASKTTAV